MLMAMRTVGSNPDFDPPGETGLEKMARDLYKKHSADFFNKLHQLEREHERTLQHWLRAKSKTRITRKKDPPIVDEGTAKCVELARNLLRELGEEFKD